MNDLNSEPTNQGDDVLAVPPGDVREVGAAHPNRGLSAKKLNAYIDERLGGELSAAAVLVRDVVKRTRLWRSEQLDVACELIDHFDEAIERGADLETAVRDFGAAKQAAKLIGQSKRRCRPWYWKSWLWGWRALGVVAIFYLIMALRFWIVAPQVTVNYLAMMNAPRQLIAEGDRAWPLYEEAHDEMRRVLAESDGPIRNFQLWEYFNRNQRTDEAYDRQMLLTGTEASDQIPATLVYQAKRQAMRAFLIDHSDLIEQMRVAAAKSYLGYTIEKSTWAGRENSIWSRFYSHSGKLQGVAGCLEWDALLAGEQGDGQRAYKDMISLFTLTMQMADHEAFYEEQRTRFTILQSGVRVLFELLGRHPELFSDTQLTGLAHQLGRTDKVLEISVKTEYLSVADGLQRAYSDDGAGDGRLTWQGFFLLGMDDLRSFGPKPRYAFSFGRGYRFNSHQAHAFAMGPLLRMGSPTRREVVSALGRLEAEETAYLKAPLWERKAMERPLVDGLKAVDDLDPLSFMVPMFSASRRDRALAFRDTALVVIALELYRRRIGQYPDTLEPLVGRYLPAIPPDLGTGDPMRYVLTAKGPVLYMVGQDEDDDGGRESSDEGGKPVMSILRRWSAVNWAPEGRTPDGDWVLYPNTVQ